jgi:cholesterol transport system auxiliary component
MIRRIAQTAIVAAAVTVAVGLSGCVSLFPKSEAVTLYKLALPPGPPASQPAQAGPTASVLLGPLAFTRPAAGDRILTTNGLETAFVGGARWVAPAPIMFQEALSTAFDQTPGLNLATRGEAVASDFVLRVEIRTFEAQYTGQGPLTAQGKKGKQPVLSAPTAVVEAHVTLLNLREKAEVSDMTFREAKPAADNRVTAIVNAYDDATASVIHDIVGWTAGLAKPQPKTTTR